MNPIAVALSLMREALTLLEEPEAEPVAEHLRIAIKVAENKKLDLASSPPIDTDGEP